MNYIEKFKNYTTKQTINLIMKGLINTSDQNLIRLTYAAERIAPQYKTKIQKVRKSFQDKTPVYVLVQKTLKEIHPNYRDKMVSNFIVDYLLLGPKRRAEVEKKLNITTPATIVISPTTRCNLGCTGCYAGDYPKKNDLPIELVDKVITEAKELGTNFFTISGGEPFVRKDMLDIYKLMKLLTDKGCTFGWYFTYIPIGSKPDVDLMQTPEQRLYGWRRVNYLRNKYPVFIGDFWNDGMHVGGCIAGGNKSSTTL